MGIYSKTLGCGCQTQSSTLEPGSNTQWYSKRCVEHTPKQGDVILYDLSRFLRMYCEGKEALAGSYPVVAYVCEAPYTYTLEESTYNRITLRVRLPPGIRVTDKAYELMRVSEETFGDYKIIVAYSDDEVIPSDFHMSSNKW